MDGSEEVQLKKKGSTQNVGVLGVVSLAMAVDQYRTKVPRGESGKGGGGLLPSSAMVRTATNSGLPSGITPNDLVRVGVWSVL